MVLIRVCVDPWLRDSTSMRIESPVIPELPILTVNELMIPSYMERDVELLHKLFNNKDVEQILNINPLCMPQFDGCLILHFTKNGLYSVNSGYRIATEHLHDEILVRATGLYIKLLL